MRNTCNVNILGAEWAISIVSVDDCAMLQDCDGYTDWTTREIVVAALEPRENSVKDLALYQRKVLRHEIVHAFLFESGLGSDTGSAECWTTNEEMVDWIAMQGPKICEAWKAADAL